MKEYRSSSSHEAYPTVIREHRNAQAFYGVIRDLFDEVGESINPDSLGALALEVDQVIRNHRKVDWHHNMEIHNRIEQELDDLLFDYKEKYNLDIDFDTIDKIIEQVKTIAMKRY